MTPEAVAVALARMPIPDGQRLGWSRLIIERAQEQVRKNREQRKPEAAKSVYRAWNTAGSVR